MSRPVFQTLDTHEATTASTSFLVPQIAPSLPPAL
jgi:hypothetical protein